MGDTLDEIDETFLVNLGNPLNGSLQDSQGNGTIIDDDLPPNMSIEDVTVIDGIASNVLATFVVRLDAPSGKQITVNFATQDDSAIAPQDYLSATGRATIAPDDTDFDYSDCHRFLGQRANRKFLHEFERGCECQPGR